MKTIQVQKFLLKNGKKFSIKLLKNKVDEFDILKSGKEKQTSGNLFSSMFDAEIYFNTMIKLYINLGKTPIS